MSKLSVLSLFFLAVFLQAGTYGLTFLLPKLFATFGANEKDVGAMLAITRSKQGWVSLPDTVTASPEYYDAETVWAADSLKRRNAALASA